MSNEKPKKSKKWLIVICSVFFFFLILTYFGVSASKNDYDSCVNQAPKMSYRGRTQDSENQAKAKDLELLSSQKTLCSGIYKQQSGISYLFNKGTRDRNIRQHCDNMAVAQRKNIAELNAQPMAKTLFGEQTYDYNETYNQCLHQFGL